MTHILENHQTYREQGKIDISAQTIGEFLYRSVRIKKQSKGNDYERAYHPYPSCGALNEIEIYPFVYSCDGISPGAYRYDALAHELEHLSLMNSKVELILKKAQSTLKMNTIPQIVIVLAAKFQRMMWKYESNAYALILKNSGIISHTMYLVATAMNLAPCGIGGGSSDDFCDAIGTDYWEETSVGEFVLGSKSIS